MATGRLGSAIANCFCEYGEVERIFYLHGEGAVRPKPLKVEFVPITDFNSLEHTVREITSSSRIDAIIHAMAVSDYRVRSVTTVELIAQSAAADDVLTYTDALKAIDDAQTLDRSSKLSSSEENLVLMLERTPKLIEQLQIIAPDALLVGFKLTDGAPHDSLIAAAKDLHRRGNCFLTLANDKKTVTPRGHIGYLLDREDKITRFDTKEQIARGITSRVIDELKSRGR
jgi:phosphopantothenate-cysteine ligase